MVKYCLFALVALFVIFFLISIFGPRVFVDTSIRSTPLPEDLDEHLSISESKYSDIVEGAEKAIRWSGEVGIPSEYSIVYLHGFAATRQEIDPVVERVAGKMGANVFYTRYSGHGRISSDAMVEASVGNWIEDTIEAIQIGQRIGKRVIVVATSTGATTLTWLLGQKDFNLHALVLASPNFRPADSKSQILLWPWGVKLAELINGKDFTWKKQPISQEHAKFWTQKMPTKALAPMVAIVDLAKKTDLARIKIPVCIIYSPDDQLVSPAETEKRFQEFGPHPSNRLIPVRKPGSPGNHIVGGRIMAPEMTGLVVSEIFAFLEEIDFHPLEGD